MTKQRVVSVRFSMVDDVRLEISIVEGEIQTISFDGMQIEADVETGRNFYQINGVIFTGEGFAKIREAKIRSGH